MFILIDFVMMRNLFILLIAFSATFSSLLAQRNVSRAYTHCFVDTYNYTVSFDLGDHGTRSGGGAVQQTVFSGQSATAPTIEVDTGWLFSGWSAEFNAVTSNLTVAAQYKQKEYNVTFNLGAYGTRAGGGALNQSVVHGASATAPTIEVAAGWLFNSWSDVFYAIASDLTVVADYERGYYVSFDLGAYGTHAGGGALQQTLRYGQSATEPTIDAAAGWLFSGWSADSSAVTSNMTVVAQYERETYNVSFDMGGHGTRTGGGTLIQNVVHGDSATAPTIDVDRGWLFSGWSADFNAVTSNLSVVAQYERETYNVSFDLGAYGTRAGGGTLNQSVVHGGWATAPTIDENTGWLFSGWSATFNAVTSNLIVRASYNPAHDVTFDLGVHGTRTGGGALTQRVAVNDSATAPTVRVSAGWLFSGWSTEFNAVTSNMTVLAQYEQKEYNVTFDLGAYGTQTGGALNQTLAHGDSATAPTIEVDTGWLFSGWSADFNAVTSNLTVAAQYKQKEYNVTFDLGAYGTRTGGGALNQSVVHGASATAPTIEVAEFWLFSGWSKAYDVITSQLTVRAIYNRPLSVSSNLVSTTSGDNVVLTANGLNGYYNLETVRWYTTGYLYPSLLSAGSSFTIYDVSVDDERTYWFEAETIEGEVVPSESFELTLDSASGLKILVHPTSRSVSSGSTVTLSVSATGNSLSYQWQKGGVAIAGATSASYTLSSVSASDAGAYTVVVSNSAGRVTSNAAALSVEDLSGPGVEVPSIDTQPISQSVTSGDNVTLSVSARGGSLSYQWQTYLPPAGWQDIQGATSSNYTASYNAISDGGAFKVVISNSAGSVASEPVQVLVDDLSKSYTLYGEVAMTWSEAISYAKSQGGYLLEINSYGEWLSIIDFLENSLAAMSDEELDNLLWSSFAFEDSAAYVWLGGSDAAVEGEWLWVSSSGQFWSGGVNGSAVAGAFNRWGTTTQQNEPDNFEGSQNALALALEAWPWQTGDTDGQLGYAYEWNDLNSQNQLFFIMEQDLDGGGPPLWPSGFSPEAYLALNSDLAAALGSDHNAAWQHYLNYGVTEGRTHSDSFSIDDYLSLNGDLAAAFGSDKKAALEHWFNYGVNEGRQALVVVESWPSGFSPSDYLALNSDLAAALGSDHNAAWEHYLNYGVTEGRSHSDSFSVDDYLSLNGDLAAAFGSDKKAALEHWFNYGINEGRQALVVVESWPSGFSPSDYLARYSDLAAAFGTDYNAAWEHYLNYGVTEGRSHSDSFSVDDYLSLNGDLAAAFGSDKKAALEHWFNYGMNEGRSALEVVSDSWPSGFSPSDYLSRYSDLAAAFGTDYNAAWQHYLNYGVTEGRTHSDSFSVDDYLSLNGDLAAAFGSDKKAALEHWFNYGINEGRSALEAVSDSWPSGFSPSDYLARYSDLAAAFGTDYNAAWEHYLNYGVTEGRTHSNSFSIDDYLSLNGDLEAAFGSDKKAALEHWFNYGMNEGRQTIKL
jgi:hypothetical protein